MKPARALVIRVEQVHKAFGAQQVLCGVDLDVPRGEMLALVGGSGSGKTVLLEHIIGHLSPDRGRVLVADHEAPGVPLVDLAVADGETLERIRRHWAVVFQRNALFSGTVYENIALWLREVARLDEEAIAARAEAALRAVDLDAAVLERDREELSGGMAKRVAIARALAMDPLILFFDEPTTGLDPGHAGHIHELIARTHASAAAAALPRTTLVITHDKDLLRRLAPRIVMLHEGRVFFDGAYRDFRQSDSPVVRPYFELMPALQARMAMT